MAQRRLPGGLRASEPAGVVPDVEPSEKEVILVQSEYPDQPGMGRRSLRRLKSRTTERPLFAPDAGSLPG